MVTDQGLPPVAEFPFGSPGPLSSSQKPRGSAQDLDGANKYLVSGTLIAWAYSSVAFPSFFQRLSCGFILGHFQGQGDL